MLEDHPSRITGPAHGSELPAKRWDFRPRKRRVTTRPLTKAEAQAVRDLARQAIEGKGINLPPEYQQRIAKDLPGLREKLGSETPHRIEITEDKQNFLRLRAIRSGGGCSTRIGKRLPWTALFMLSEGFPAPDYSQKKIFRNLLPLLTDSRALKSRLAQSYYQDNLPALVQQVEESLSGPPRIAAHLLILIHLIDPSDLDVLMAERRFKDQYELYRQCQLFHGLGIFGNTYLSVEEDLN